MCGALLADGIITVQTQNRSILDMGIGGGQDFALVKDLTRGIIPNSLLANLPQLILTAIYLLFNNSFTRKAVCREWNSFAKRPKYLRVTNPTGNQKSSYYLGLPYRFAIPLQIGSMLLHWLVSQSLYIVSFAVFDYQGHPVAIDNSGKEWSGDQFSDGKRKQFGAQDTNELVRIGFSCLGLILAMTVASILLLLGWLDDIRALWPGMPFVIARSDQISACCHMECDDAEQIVLKQLKWSTTTWQGSWQTCDKPTDDVYSVP